MLGRHADAFFRKQARERIVAVSPNGQAGTYSVPDRESPGTHKVTLVKGQYEVPGPQKVVDANTMMPVPAQNWLPGMSGDTASFLPGVGESSALPGMGALDRKTLLIGGLAVAGLVGYFCWFKKRRA